MKTYPFSKRWSDSLRIWIVTNLIATVIYIIYMIIFVGYDTIIYGPGMNRLLFAVALGLLFSYPAVLLLLPVLSWVNGITSRIKSIFCAILSVLGICVLIIIWVFIVYDTPLRDQPFIVFVLLPYILSAEISFFVIKRKMFWRPVHADSEVK